MFLKICLYKEYNYLEISVCVSDILELIRVVFQYSSYLDCLSQRATRLASSVAMATRMFVERLTSLIFLLLLTFMGDSSGGRRESEFKVVMQSLRGFYVLKFFGTKSRFY